MLIKIIKIGIWSRGNCKKYTKDIPRLRCREGHRKKDEIPQKSLSVKTWKWHSKILSRCMKNTREPNPAIFLVTPHRISSGTELKRWWASHPVSILLYHQRLLSPWLQRLIMATFFANIYAVVELPDRSPASWIKKKSGCYADSIRTDFKLLQGCQPCPGSQRMLTGLPLHPMRHVSPARSLSIWEVYSPHNPNILNSGLFWQEERIRSRVGRWKSRIIDHIFYNPGLSGFSGENGLITSRKNFPIRPFWMVNRLSDGRE